MAQPRQSLAEKAYESIEELIVTLELPPGHVFTEAELCEKLNIGRTPVREALQRLVADMLVATLPRRGMIITEINITEQLALLETRRVLDKLTASRAARRASSQQREMLKELSKEMNAVAESENLSEFMRLDRECDLIMETASKNSFAVRANSALHAHCRRFWFYHRENSDLRTSAQLHAAVIQAVANGDEEAASEASDDLLDYLEKFARSALDTFK